MPKYSSSKFLVNSFLLTIILSTCSAANDEQLFTEYRSRDHLPLETNFSIEHPPGWEVLTPEEFFGFVVVPPDYENSDIKVSVIIFPLEGQPDDLSNLENEEVLNWFAPIFLLDGVPEKLEKLTINRAPTQRFYAESDGSTFVVLIIGEGTSRFVICGYAPANNVADINVMEAIIDTFEITD